MTVNHSGKEPANRFSIIVSCLPTIIKELIYLGDEDVGDFDGEYRLVSTREYYEEWD